MAGIDATSGITITNTGIVTITADDITFEGFHTHHGGAQLSFVEVALAINQWAVEQLLKAQREIPTMEGCRVGPAPFLDHPAQDCEVRKG